MSSSDPFICSPLTLPSNIRVIYIEPGSHDEPLSLFLAAVSLNTPYRALSYVWGEDVDRPMIFLDGKHFQITTNLHALLKELRCCDTRAGPFWADAICINQSDDVEKSKQVSMMGKIYRKTGRCLVWLGEEEEGMEEAFRLFETLADGANELYDDIPGDRKRAIVEGWNETPTSKGAILLALKKSTAFQRHIYDEFLAAALPIDPPQSQVARSLRAWEVGCTIWKRGWFTRTWTLQEFVLPIAIEIRCGSLAMDADSMVICGRIYSVVYGFPVSGPPLGLDNSGFPVGLRKIAKGLQVILETRSTESWR